jgi:SNF2 family DNA or RNA helicase
MNQIANGEPDSWLILEAHPDYPGQWVVNCLEQGFLIDFIDLIGPYRTVGPGSLPTFLARAKEKKYSIAFADEPVTILDVFNDLNNPPEISLNSQLSDTAGGLLPYQVQGYNLLKNKLAGVAMWSTGTGKTVLASALLKFHSERSNFDYAFFVVKAHNKINTQRALSGLADIDSVVLDGPKKRRNELIRNVVEDPLVPKVIVTNYEKFRVDLDMLIPLFDHKRVLLIWDEMPTKLKNRKTALYKSVRKCLYKKVNLSEQRPSELRQYMLSATPIENGPDDWFNCVRLLDPTVYGTITQFQQEFVERYEFFQPVWKDLDRMGLKSAHIVHQVDKTSPDIAKQFPKVIETPLYIDWNEDDRETYDTLLDEVKKHDPLSAILAMQMLCDAPSMVSNSAALRQEYINAVNYSDVLPSSKGSDIAHRLQALIPQTLTDDNHTKLETLKELITETHRNEKIIVFSSFNFALLPILEQHFVKWGVNFVKYDGSAKDKQIAQDYFQNEDFVQVFLSSDQGSDSLSLEEASVVIHYDLPWKWSTFIQRQNRAHRVTSKWNHVRFYTLLMADSIEERKMKVLMKKAGYHDAVFKGHISEQAEASRLTREDLLYILGASNSS